MAETYPRIYRFRGWALLTWVTLELIMIAAGVAALLFAKTMFKGAAPGVGWGAGSACLAVGMAALLSTIRGRLILYADHCEYTGILGTRVLRTSDVKETREVRQQYGHLVVTVALKNGRKVTITDFGHLDDALIEWLNSFPNAEAEAEDAQAEALLANPAFGHDKDARQRAINRDRWRLAGLSAVGWAVAIWSFFYPHPYPACLTTLLALPATGLILMLLSRGRWTLAEANNGRLSLGGLAGPPAMMVGLRALLDDGVVDWRGAAVAGGGVALGLLLFILATEGWAKRGVLVILAAGCFAYGWGGLVYLNMHFDDAPAKVYTVRVLDMDTGDYGNPVTVTAWATRPGGNQVDVGNDFYRRLKVGGRFCLSVYPGALGIQWYQYDLCK